MIKRIIFFCLLSMLFALSVYSQTAPRLGDVNNDSNINIVDALCIAQYSVGLTPAVFYTSAADVNASGKIDIVDALLVAQYYIGLITQFPGAAAFEVAQSSLARNLNPQPAADELKSVVNGNNQFAFDCYKSLAAIDGNVFFSPVSISFAFAMCYAGANGITESQMAQTLHFTLPEARLHNAFNALDLAITTPSVIPDPSYGDELKLSIANSSWGQNGYTFMQEYLDVLATSYGAGLNLLDFKTAWENARITINTWVANKTEQRIKNLLPSGSVSTDTRLVLTNAIYFKANWQEPFIAANTANASFTNANGSIITVPTMNKVMLAAYSQVAGEYQAIKLPYQGKKKNSMVLILPAAGLFQSFESSLSADKYSTIVSSMSRYKVTYAMPKFSYEWSSSLKTTLQALGMKDAFSPSAADFSGINGKRDLFVSDVLHKSFVAVDEKGTEATAATAIVMAGTSVPPEATMILNRPFLFFIVNDDTGAILFSGRVSQL